MELLNMVIVKFLGYVGTHAEPLCVEFCNFMQCHIFVNFVE
jgi:hypothetical protein